MGRTKGFATMSSIPEDATELGGNPQTLAYGPELLLPWRDNPEQYQALAKLIHFLRQMYNPDQIQMCMNVCKLGGWTRDDFKDYVTAQIAAALATIFPLNAPDDGSDAYMFDDATVPGSVNAGMVFDTEFAEGPALKDVIGDAQLQVKIGEIVIQGKLTVGGLVDPTGLELSPVAANPGGTAANTLWLDNGDGNRLKHGAQLVGEISGNPTNNRLLSWNTGSKRIQDSGYTAADFAAAAHSHSDYLEKTQNLADVNDAGESLTNLGVLRAILTADDNNSGVAKPTNTDALFVTVEASKWYQFEAWLLVDYDDGFIFDLDGGTATVTLIEYDVQFLSATGAAGSSVITKGESTISGDVQVGAPEESARGPIHIKGFIQSNAAGTIRFRHCSGSGAGTKATMLAGSWMRLTAV
jgi:hypothetical protein